MPLTTTEIKNLKPTTKAYKRWDGRGLYLIIKPLPLDSKLWRFDYTYQGKRLSLGLGRFPEVSLADARKKRDEYRRLLAQGINPSAERKALKQLANQEKNTFAAVAWEWFHYKKDEWKENHARSIAMRLDNFLIPFLGNSPIEQITPPQLLKLLKIIENRGTIETAHRVKVIAGQVFRYAIATNRAERDPSADLKGALKTAKPKHFASITNPKEIGGLLRAIDGYQGDMATKTALQLLPLVFVRPGELRSAEWQEIHLEERLWKIPAEKMKAGRVHLVPLSKQAVALLEAIRPLTGHRALVFPSPRSVHRPLSDNTLNGALRRLGYSAEQMTSHGFRSMASTLLNEKGYPPDVIERQLAHIEGNKVRAAYNHAEYLPERKKMMQDWADYLEALKGEGSNGEKA